MPSATYRWTHFPFGIAGPLSLVLAAGTSLAGALSLAYVPPRWQAWVGLCVFVVLWGSLFLARRAFASRRNLNANTRAYALGTRSSNRTLIVAGLISVIVPRALGWHDGAIWVLYGITFYAHELYWLLKWRALGYPGAATSGWARADRRPSEDTPA
jgi:hypothetical protein